jgi:TatD DNase family protein
VNLFDTHAHLDAPQFAADREAVVARARDAGVEIICVSTDLESSVATVRLVGARHAVPLRCAVGIHPHEAGRYVDGCDLGLETRKRLADLTKNPRVVAIGEIGLDYFKNYAPRSAQLSVFRAQLELARELNLPVIVHMRDAAEDLLTELRSFPGLRGVIHSFTGDQELANHILALDFYLGLNGIVTFSKDPALREAVQRIRMDRLLIETDAPYLAPVPHRGRRNEPAFVRHVAEFIADLRGLSPEELARVTTGNVRELFGFSPQ